MNAICHECGKPCSNHEYIVRAAVWQAAGMEKHGGLLHMRCLEKRLGRCLVTADFLVRPMPGHVNKKKRATTLEIVDHAAYVAEWPEEFVDDASA